MIRAWQFDTVVDLARQSVSLGELCTKLGTKYKHAAPTSGAVRGWWRRAREKRDAPKLSSLLGADLYQSAREPALNENIPPLSKLRPEPAADCYVLDDGPLPARLICDSDNHIPIEDARFQAAKIAFARDFKPDLWVNCGDQYDCYSISSYPKERGRLFGGSFTLQQEMDAGRDYWRSVADVAKRVVYIPGNHEARISKFIDTAPGLHGLRSLGLAELAQLPDKVRLLSYGEIFKVGPLSFEHGDKIGGAHGCTDPTKVYLASNRGHKSVIFGHHHRSQLAHKTYFDDEGEHSVVAISQGHGSDVTKAKYVTHPPWVHSFTAVEFYRDGDRVRFTAYPIVAVHGRFSWGGKVYGLSCQ